MEKSQKKIIPKLFKPSWGIKIITSTPVNPQANGQAESSNKIIINSLKKKLGAKKGKWAEELPYVLWADKTTPKNATGQTPFSLVFGVEAVIPTEMVYPTARISTRDPQTNEETLAQDLDTVEKLRDQAKFRIAAYQQKMADSCFVKYVKLQKCRAIGPSSGKNGVSRFIRFSPYLPN
ncbi:uncharacterized protein LOC143537429 [Bidens hawaiensis]|uniref:uncharacterized protein LOC143537429 n=1 Tax=Bidens hawaiensis TaxID=980011 RepID=UPI00404B3390